MLILGRTGEVSLPAAEGEVEEYSGALMYHDELLNDSWKMCRVQVFPHLPLYHCYKEACCHANEGKVRRTYKLCRVLEMYLS